MIPCHDHLGVDLRAYARRHRALVHRTDAVVTVDLRLADGRRYRVAYLRERRGLSTWHRTTTWREYRCEATADVAHVVEPVDRRTEALLLEALGEAGLPGLEWDDDDRTVLR